MPANTSRERANRPGTAPYAGAKRLQAFFILGREARYVALPPALCAALSAAGIADAPLVTLVHVWGEALEQLIRAEAQTDGWVRIALARSVLAEQRQLTDKRLRQHLLELERAGALRIHDVSRTHFVLQLRPHPELVLNLLSDTRIRTEMERRRPDLYPSGRELPIQRAARDTSSTAEEHASHGEEAHPAREDVDAKTDQALASPEPGDTESSTAAEVQAFLNTLGDGICQRLAITSPPAWSDSDWAKARQILEQLGSEKARQLAAWITTPSSWQEFRVGRRIELPYPTPGMLLSFRHHLWPLVFDGIRKPGRRSGGAAPYHVAHSGDDGDF